MTDGHKGQSLLEIRDLSVNFATDGGDVEVVDKVSIGIEEGKVLALVGESGCGKTVTASSVLRLLPHPQGRITSGEILFEGKDILAFEDSALRELRGGKISMIFQEPLLALNPVHTVRSQLLETLKLHRKNLDNAEIDDLLVAGLEAVQLASPRARLKDYPFQLSGGMRQRVMIAMALLGKPRLLIADEPTTALDVTVQAQILALLETLRITEGLTMLYITHDMAVVGAIAHDVAVMYAGQIMEKSSTELIFNRSLHPYTQGLLDSMPRLGAKPKTPMPMIKGQVPSPKDYGMACRFAGRCPLADDHCRKEKPELLEWESGHFVRCFKAGPRG